MRFHVLAIMIGLAACGEDSVSFDDYPQELHNAYCKFLVKCHEVENMDACKHANIGISIHISASTQAMIDMGKVKYDGAKARQCLDGIANESCDQTAAATRVEPAACRDLAAGTVHANAACADDAECISQTCDIPTCQMACCMGSCVGDSKPVDAKLGESCMNASCVKGTHCDTTSTTCVALKPSGMACTTGAECDYGLSCVGVGTARACGTLPKPDEACTAACRDIGTTCSPTTQTCVAVGFAGAACNTSAECGITYRCDTTKHCAAGIALGAACNTGDRCADEGAFCDVPVGSLMGACTLPKADGQPCQRDANCESRTCDPVLLTCAAETVCI